MCTADLGFTAAKKYDIEVWIPSYETYREISSCSNFEALSGKACQYSLPPGCKSKTTTRSHFKWIWLAIGRTVAAILENYQQDDGTVEIPKVLRPYMGNRELIG